MTEPTWEVIVIGAGAAGLMAAATAERGCKTLLLEKNRKPGVKILMSGGTRCNITQATDNRGIVEQYGPPGKFLHSALAAFSVDDTIAFFESHGVPTKVEDTGKIFPVSNKAADVLDALIRYQDQAGAILALDESLTDLRRADNGFVLTTARRTLHAERVILTTGGQSYPGSGTTGDGYRFAKALGHTIVPPRPALVPLTTSVPWVAELRGITLADVAVQVRDGKERLTGRRGSLLFAHFGLSGPVILDVSRVVSGHAQPSTLTLEIDLLPGTSEQELSEWLRLESLAVGKKQLSAVLSGRFPRRLGDVILAHTGMPLDRKAAALSKDERRRLVAVIQRLELPLTGTLGFKKAEVTAGGIALAEVDSRTLESRIVPGLFLAGEILDLDGPIGGYNFQAAWSTGYLAGSSV